MEANLLRYLIQHEGKPVSRKRMLEEVWGVHEDTDTRAHRQLHRAAAALYRGRPDPPAAPDHRTGRRLSICCISRYEQ